MRCTCWICFDCDCSDDWMGAIQWDTGCSFFLFTFAFSIVICKSPYTTMGEIVPARGPAEKREKFTLKGRANSPTIAAELLYYKKRSHPQISLCYVSPVRAMSATIKTAQRRRTK